MIAWPTVWLKPRAGVGPYSTVLSPVVSVHHAKVIVVVNASGFSLGIWMDVPRRGGRGARPYTFEPPRGKAKRMRADSMRT